MAGSEVEVLPVGHHARPAAALALWVSVAAAVVFTAFAYVTTQDHAVRAVSPWQDDPYDGVVSFTQFLVPALTMLTVLRASLNRRRPQPVFRTFQLLRAALVSTLLVAATVVTDWLAVAVRADRSAWSRGTPWLVAALVPLTAAVVAFFVLWRRANRRLPSGDRGRPDLDWLDDLTALAGLLPRPARGLAGPPVTGFVRTHIVAFAAAAALVGGLLLTTGQAVGEGWSSPLLILLAIAIDTGAFFAFAMISNVVLQIAVPRDDARPRAEAAGRVRRAAGVATVAGSLSLPASVALRNVIWAAAGHGHVDSVGGLAVVTVAGALLTSALAFVVSLIVTTPAGRAPAA